MGLLLAEEEEAELLLLDLRLEAVVTNALVELAQPHLPDLEADSQACSQMLYLAKVDLWATADLREGSKT